MTSVKLVNQNVGEAGEAVLVVDDDAQGRAEMASLLRRAGFRVLDLPSPIGVTKNVIAHAITIVVVRVGLGAANGNWIPTLFRSNTRLRDVSVILVTDDTQLEVHQVAAETNADAIIARSNLVELVPAVQRAHQRRARHSMSPVPE